MCIHEICEELSIKHESHGEGELRYVSIARPSSLLTKRMMKIGSSNDKPSVGEIIIRNEEG